MISYQQFRSNALQGLTMMSKKQRPRFKSKDDQEQWVSREYNRHNRKATNA